MAQGCEATHTARGLAHSEGRKDPGWPHHLLTGRVAHGFLWPLTRRLGKKRPSADGGATAPLVSGAPPHTPLHGSRGPRAGGVGPAVASPGLSVAEKASEHGWRKHSEPLMETPKRIFWRLHECSSSHCLASCLMHGLAQGRMIPSAGGVGPTDPHAPSPPSRRASPPRLRLLDGALLPDTRKERGEDAWPSAEQGRNERPHPEHGVRKGPWHVHTRGWITVADVEGLLRLPGARACPSPRRYTGATGDGHVRGRDDDGQRGPQGGRVKSAGQ